MTPRSVAPICSNPWMAIWPLRDLCLIVAGLPLTGLVGIRGKLAGEHDGAIGPPGGRDAFGLADVTEFEEHRVGIVNRPRSSGSSSGR